jgi:phosphate acyltransferase
LSARLTIALDVMGGDRAPDIVLKGANIARERFPQTDYLLFGDEPSIKRLLDRLPRLRKVATVLHTDEVVSNDDKLSVALRKMRRSSMGLAIHAVAESQAAAAVSAGNTGALMAMAKVVLKTLPGIDRPAIASFFPTRRGESVMLDLGANVECDADNLAEFAVMGSVFAQVLLGLDNPKVGLLNVGSEEMKGHDEVRQAAAWLKRQGSPINFYGFVEGNDIGTGVVDVVVTDGFTGNVALKSIEGTAKLYTGWVRDAFRTSTFAKIGYLFASGAWVKLRKRVDPRRYNGGVFLGLEGICVKSHGGTDALGFAYAIGVAVDLVRYDYKSKLVEGLGKLRQVTTTAEASPALQASGGAE